MRRELFSRRRLGQFQTFSLVLSCAVWQCYAFSVWVYYWISLCIRMASEKVCSDLPDLVSPTSRFVNMTFVMKIVYGSWLHQPKRKKGTIHTLIYCRMDISSRKCSRIHYSWCPTAFISLLISIMKMLYHLSDKNHLFQELKPWRPCGTTLVLWFTNHSFLYRKWYFSLDRPPANKSSHCWNAFRAADWRHHHISSYRIRYPK